jgi:cytochrome c oxidase subunit II
MIGRALAFKLAAILALAGTGGLVTACDGVLDPQGPRAREIYDLWWFLFALGTAVFVLTFLAMVYALVRRRPATEDPRAREPIIPVVIAGGVLPAIILLILMGANLMVMASARDAENAEADLTIEIVGHMWWWEVRYPEQGFVTANEIHIPTGQVVRLRLTSADVIHSFWVPQLQGKLDLVPGDVHTLTLQADNAGVYQGFCAEFCGVQHANMRMLVIAESPADFQAWADEQRGAPAPPQTQQAVRGQQIFLQNCMVCHAVRGTEATSTVGPDLTRVAGRRTIGAATAENTRNNLTSWVLDPHAFKPGVFMPQSPLSIEDLEALIEYLETLR